MRRSVSPQIVPRFCLLPALLLGILAFAGCAARPENDVAFRRFWGFEPAAPGAAENATAPSGLVSTLLGREFRSSKLPQDPFLAQNFEASSGTTGQVTVTVDQGVGTAAVQTDPSGATFIPPVIVPGPPGQAGNPFRVVEHQTPVSEISPPEVSHGNPGRQEGPESQLDRLKTALTRDAQTPLPTISGAEASEVIGQRVETLMKNARVQIELGEYVSALRWAKAAEQLAARAGLFFGPDEDPPADLVRSLEDRLKIPPEPIPPPIPSIPPMAETTLPTPVPSADASETPEFSIALPKITPRNTEPKPTVLTPELVGSPSALPHSRAMQEAVIAPETILPREEELPEPWSTPGVITPSQRHARSLKIDARRVSANQGAVVSVEGQLNPPVEPRMPDVPLAPPVMEDASQLPPLGAVMNEPIPTPTPPPLPPLSAMDAPQPEPSPFLYADNTLPAPEPKKNVHWDDADLIEPATDWTWWIFPAMGMSGVVLLGVLLLKRKRS